MNQTIELHKHKFAAWSASTAARASPLCRFNVEAGIAVLESAGFTSEFSDPSSLPRPENIDTEHRAWRDSLMAEASTRGINNFTHGVAAKLANTYLKVRFVCGGYHEHPHVARLHPPVDKLLLEGLAAEDVGGFAREWRKYAGWGWSKYSTTQYEEVIEKIRRAIGDHPLWEIEQYWRGYQ